MYLKIIFFIALFGLFFAYWISQDIFVNFQSYIQTINTDFFKQIPTEILFLFTFFIFILILTLIFTFYR